MVRICAAATRVAVSGSPDKKEAGPDFSERGFPSWYSGKRVTTRCCGPASPEPRNPLPASNQEYLSGNPLFGERGPDELVARDPGESYGGFVGVGDLAVGADRDK